MKQRVLTGIIGGAVAIGWVFTINTPVFAPIMAVFSVIAVYEMLKVFNVTNLPFKILCWALTVFITLYPDYSSKLNIPMFPAVTLVVLAALVMMVTDFKRLRFEQVVCSLFSSTLIPASLSTVVLFRDTHKAFPGIFSPADGIFFLLLAFFTSWLTDAFALFAGKAFGKHKLAPTISPKKTVEGAIGGLIGNCLMCVALFFVFSKKFDLCPHIKLYHVIIASILLGVISMFGDLAASTIKRHHGIKDFGNLLPGHGGVMDRFDSCLFVFPALYSMIVIMAKYIWVQ